MYSNAMTKRMQKFKKESYAEIKEVFHLTKDHTENINGKLAIDMNGHIRCICTINNNNPTRIQEFNLIKFLYTTYRFGSYEQKNKLANDLFSHIKLYPNPFDNDSGFTLDQNGKTESFDLITSNNIPTSDSHLVAKDIEQNKIITELKATNSKLESEVTKLINENNTLSQEIKQVNVCMDILRDTQHYEMIELKQQLKTANNKIKQQEKSTNLKKELKEMKIKLDQCMNKINSMQSDYDSYQTIKKFEYIYNQLTDLYGIDTHLDLLDAMKFNPTKAQIILGANPIQKYNELRKTRNILAHDVTFI